MDHVLVDSRKTSLVGNKIFCGFSLSEMAFTSNLAARLPFSKMGWCTVDRVGLLKHALGISSKPITSRSCGTCTPSSLAAISTHNAMASLNAKTALG